MPVTGAKEVVAALSIRLPARLREYVEDALKQASFLVLQDMKALTPIDGSNPGPHAADGLTVVFDDQGLRSYVGLPNSDLSEKYFWFRFLDDGTKGGEVRYRRDGQIRTMNVPARPAMRIRERAIDGNREEIERLIVEAINRALRSVR